MTFARIARLLGGSTKFGAELDSLSDVISFGVAPAVTLYLWSLKGASTMGWTVALIFAVCCALRLARFNTKLDDIDPMPWAGQFFTGVPAPAGAGLAVLPIMLSFEFGDTVFRHPAVAAPVIRDMLVASARRRSIRTRCNISRRAPTGLHHRHASQVAIKLVVVQAEAHHKAVRDFEAVVIYRDLHDAARVAIQKRADR